MVTTDLLAPSSATNVASPAEISAGPAYDVTALIDRLNRVGSVSMGDMLIVMVDADKEMAAHALHLCIARYPGAKSMIIVVDGMDRAGYEYVVFKDCAVRLRTVARSFGMTVAHCIPVATARGIMVTTRGDAIDWYDGPTLHEAAEHLSQRTDAIRRDGSRDH